MMRRARHAALTDMNEKRNACKVLVGKSEGEGPLWRTREILDGPLTALTKIFSVCPSSFKENSMECALLDHDDFL
jgi:hypothetical protein